MIRNAGRIVWRAFIQFQDHSGPDRAAAVSYYTLLSLLPLLIFLISLGGTLLGSFEAAYRGSLFLVRGVVVHMDPASLEALHGFVTRATRLRWPGLVLLAWTSRRIFASLFSALERVFGVPGRSFAKHNLVALAMVLVTGVALLFTMVLTMLSATSEGLLMRFRTSGAFQDLGIFLTHFVPAAVTFTFFFLLYRFVPRRVVSNAPAAIGALLATVLWETAKATFAYYIRHLARYSGVYGALEGIIVLALWLEISVSIVLFCGEIVALTLPARRSKTVPGHTAPIAPRA